jgi:hypothetical protein
MRKHLDLAASVVDKEAALFGFKRPLLELERPVTAETLADLPALLDQEKTKRLRAGLRTLDRIARAEYAEVTPEPEKEHADAAQAEGTEGPGDDRGDGDGGPVEGDADREAPEEGFTVGAG